jgi:AmmeMemoRadiSam system protein A
MGLFERENPLYVNVLDRTITAATGDPRFEKVQYSELKDIRIDISVLTEPEQLQFDSPEDLLAKLQPNRHGVILITKYGSSTYLPQVWEQIPNKEDFLSRLCAKHNAPHNLWRTDYKNIEVHTYRAIVFGEEIYGRRVIGKKGAVVGEGGAFVLGSVTPLPEGNYFGGYRISEGTELAPGAIVTPDSDIIER